MFKLQIYKTTLRESSKEQNYINISNINDDSIIFSYLNNIVKNKNININNYDIYFQRNKEWFNKFIFYKKNKI